MLIIYYMARPLYTKLYSYFMNSLSKYYKPYTCMQTFFNLCWLLRHCLNMHMVDLFDRQIIYSLLATTDHKEDTSYRAHQTISYMVTTREWHNWESRIDMQVWCNISVLPGNKTSSGVTWDLEVIKSVIYSVRTLLNCNISTNCNIHEETTIISGSKTVYTLFIV